MVEAAHQRAVDEETIGDHGTFYIRHCERSEAIHRTTESVDCFVAIAPRNDGERNTYTAATSSLTTANFESVIRPKLVLSATSAASLPVPIRMRPMRG